MAGVASALMATRAGEAGRWVAHTIEVRQVARELMGAAQDAELAQRGFLLTGDPDYLEPYAAVTAAIERTLARLRGQVGDNPNQQARLDLIEPTLQKRLSIIDQTIALAKDGRRNEAIALVKGGEGKAQMDALRGHIADFMQAELALLSERQTDADSIRHWLLVFIGFTLAAAAALGLLIARSARHYIDRLRHRTGELEAEAKLRKATEDTLRQAQKIEAVGQLSGGIAHDFNNLLTIIMGNLDTMARRMAQVKPDRDAAELAAVLTRPVELAMQGSRSAAQLTQRLLAFSRRQALDPVRLDINKLVAGMSELLRRTLGETINVETVLAGGLWQTLVDANQLENAIINLAVNARDAMPEGGSLTIETANTYLDEAYTARFGDLTPGQYVLLSVTDTGTGIPTDVLQRVFEPFFTTKETGKGSGLGLAMVHGFVKQSEGHIRIYSEENQGTTVKIYLPRLMDETKVASVPAPVPVPRSAAARAQNGEVVLVVEDNEGVRDYASASLRELGYEVYEAADAAEAFEQIRNGAKIDLLFTDVVLPGGLSGRVLAEKIGEKYPDLPVLFTTGYTRNAIVHHGRLDPHVHLLNKPYTQQDLARKVRQLLDGETTGGRPARPRKA
jgi:signal transduction histidine kinase/CheY-like chemotaxis protein